MTSRLSKLALAAAAVGTIGLAGLIPSAASAAYTTTRCDGDDCRVVRCDNDGDDCYTIRRFDRDDYDRRSGYGNRHWVCDRDGDDCRWAYGRGYDRDDDRPYHYGW